MKKPKSAQPRKQRKWLFESPLHIKSKMVSSPLSRELRSKYNRRRLTPRKGDTIEVVRGEHKGVSGEVSKVDTKGRKVYVSGVTAKKIDGTEVERPIDASNIVIKELFMEDKERRDILERTARK